MSILKALYPIYTIYTSSVDIYLMLKESLGNYPISFFHPETAHQFSSKA